MEGGVWMAFCAHNMANCEGVLRMEGGGGRGWGLDGILCVTGGNMWHIVCMSYAHLLLNVVGLHEARKVI